MKDSPFYPQAELVVKLIPLIFREQCFALKGGTAINFFLRDLPRLSVDIDLAYIPTGDRQAALKGIKDSLGRCALAIEHALPGARVRKTESKLLVRHNNASVKIETNFVIRGSVFPVREHTLSRTAQDRFGLFAAAPVLSQADLYGGKLCAALDRQHPRDLFDIKILLDDEGITSDIRMGFIIHLISHDRSMGDLLEPSIKDIRPDFEGEFQGMTEISVALSSLKEIQMTLGKMVRNVLTENEKQFLVHFKEGAPRWDLLDIPGIEHLPAVQWKLLNIRRMDKDKQRLQVKKLRGILGI